MHDPRVVVGGAHAIAAAGADLSTGSRHRIYVRAGDVPDLSLRYQLEVDPDGELEIVAIPDDVPEAVSPGPGDQTPIAAALVDPLEDPDARSRSLAEHWLQALVNAALQPSAPSDQPEQRTARRSEQASAQ